MLTTPFFHRGKLAATKKDSLPAPEDKSLSRGNERALVVTRRSTSAAKRRKRCVSRELWILVAADLHNSRILSLFCHFSFFQLFTRSVWYSSRRKRTIGRNSFILQLYWTRHRYANFLLLSLRSYSHICASHIFAKRQLQNVTSFRYFELRNTWRSNCWKRYWMRKYYWWVMRCIFSRKFYWKNCWNNAIKYFYVFL